MKALEMFPGLMTGSIDGDCGWSEFGVSPGKAAET